MLPEKHLADYLAGTLPPDESAAREAQLLADPEAMRVVVDQRRMDAALRGILDPQCERLETAIMANIQSAGYEALEEGGIAGVHAPLALQRFDQDGRHPGPVGFASRQ